MAEIELTSFELDRVVSILTEMERLNIRSISEDEVSWVTLVFDEVDENGEYLRKEFRR